MGNSERCMDEKRERMKVSERRSWRYPDGAVSRIKKCSLPGSNWRSSDCSWNPGSQLRMRPTLYRLSQGSLDFQRFWASTICPIHPTGPGSRACLTGVNAFPTPKCEGPSDVPNWPPDNFPRVWRIMIGAVKNGGETLPSTAPYPRPAVRIPFIHPHHAEADHREEDWGRVRGRKGGYRR